MYAEYQNAQNNCLCLTTKTDRYNLHPMGLYQRHSDSNDFASSYKVLAGGSSYKVQAESSSKGAS